MISKRELFTSYLNKMENIASLITKVATKNQSTSIHNPPIKYIKSAYPLKPQKTNDLFCHPF